MLGDPQGIKQNKETNKQTTNNWVFGIKYFFDFHLYLGRWSNLTNIFERGWNQQLETNNQQTKNKKKEVPSVKLTFWHLKMDDWKTGFLLGWPIFRGELLVSGRVNNNNKQYGNWKVDG